MLYLLVTFAYREVADWFVIFSYCKSELISLKI